MTIFGWMNNLNTTPSFIGVSGDQHEQEDKLYHDSYEVFVNGDYVGNKILLTQVERLSDVDQHLKANNFNNFKVETIGNRVDIKTDDLSEARRIKQNLNIHFNTR